MSRTYQEPLTDQSLMPFGQHTDKEMKDVPDKYLLEIWTVFLSDWPETDNPNSIGSRLRAYILARGIITLAET